MQQIFLAQTANQEVTTNLEGIRWVLTFKETQNGYISATVVRNSETLVSNIICVNGTPILPYRYLMENGNFFFDVVGDDLPNWRNFGDTCNLMYITAGEIEEMLNA